MLYECIDSLLFEEIHKYMTYYRSIKYQLPNVDQSVMDDLLELGTQAFFARDELFYRYKDIAAKSITKDINKRFTDEDLINIAYMELLKLIENYQPKGNYSSDEFKNYVAISIKNSTLRYIQNQSGLVEFPEEWFTYKRKINAYINSCKKENQREPDVTNIARFCQLSERMVHNVLNMQHFIYENAKNELFVASIQDPESNMIEEMKVDIIYRELDRLEEKRREIFESCFSGVSSESIAKRFNISVQRVSQIKNEVILQLKKSIDNDEHLKKLKENLERINRASINISILKK